MDKKDIYGRHFYIETEKFIIRNLRITDVDDIFSYASNPEVSKYLPWNTHTSIEDTFSYLNLQLENYRNGEVAAWGIELKETRKLIGTAGFIWWNAETKTTELGYALSPEFHNKGIMTEIVKIIIDFGFNVMELEKIEAHCVFENTASEKVMIKSHMVFDCIRENYKKFKGIDKSFKFYYIDKKIYNKNKLYFSPLIERISVNY